VHVVGKGFWERRNSKERVRRGGVRETEKKGEKRSRRNACRAGIRRIEKRKDRIEGELAKENGMSTRKARDERGTGDQEQEGWNKMAPVDVEEVPGQQDGAPPVENGVPLGKT
jgi:hypothetical protein